MATERRWIILSEDGRHVTVGRHTDPSEDEITSAGEQVRRVGVGGWLAVLQGGYYSPRNHVSLMMVREIAETRQTSDAAVAAFIGLRKQANKAPAP